jgi:hypothetical protein
MPGQRPLADSSSQDSRIEVACEVQGLELREIGQVRQPFVGEVTATPKVQGLQLLQRGQVRQACVRELRATRKVQRLELLQWSQVRHAQRP